MTPQQIDAMKLALEALEQTTHAFLDTEGSHGRIEQEATDAAYNAITALEEVLAEHAMREVQRLGREIEQEPAGWEVGVVDGVVIRRLAPPQRTWVGLTDEEIDRLWSQSLADTKGETYLPLREFARAIEAAHGIKENK